MKPQPQTYDPSATTATAGVRGLLLCIAACCVASGCASLTNPVANSIPVRMLPEELKAPSREGFEQIPLTLLRQPPPKEFRLAAGDTLGVYIDGVLGSAETPPPVNLPATPELPPSIGYPIPIRADGAVTLPLVGALPVAGLTIDEAEQLVIDAYTKPRDGRQADAAGEDEGFLRKDTQILVTMMRPRHVRVLVVREDSPQQQVSLRNESLIGLGTTETTIGGGYRGVGQVLELPAYENDVLNALARTGGLPGLESTQEVVIQRGYWSDQAGSASAAAAALDQDAANRLTGPPRIIRLPLRVRPGEPYGFGPEDVILQTGDIVTVRGRQPQFFYTGGLLPAAEHPLPNDYDLTTLEAVLRARGPLFNGGVNTSNLNGAVIGFGVGNPSPNLLAVLRKTPGGGQVIVRVDLDEAARDPRQDLLVQAGDVLILQEAPDQAVTRYFTSIFRLDFSGLFINRADAQGAVSVAAP